MYKQKGIGTKVFVVFTTFLIIIMAVAVIDRIINNRSESFSHAIIGITVGSAIGAYANRPETLTPMFRDKDKLINAIKDILDTSYSLEQRTETTAYFKIKTNNPITNMMASDILVEFGTDVALIRCDAIWKRKIEKALIGKGL